MKSGTSNKVGIGILILVVTWVAFGFFATGCAPEDMVSVQTPARLARNPISNPNGLPPKMSLRDSKAEFEIWSGTQVKIAEEWQMRNAEGEAKANFIRVILASGWEAAQGTVTTAVPVPFQAPILSLMTAIGGALAFKRPGDVKGEEHRKGKQNSFNTGFKAAWNLAFEKAGMTPAPMPDPPTPNEQE